MILKIRNKLKNRDSSHFFKFIKFKIKKRNGALLFKNFGFSLLEVFLAMLILSLGLIGVLRAYAGSVEVLEAGQYTIDMSNLLRLKMAEIEQDILENTKLTGAVSGKFEGAFADFKWRWSVKPVVLEDREGLNEVTLTVSHKDIRKTDSLVTYYVEKKKEE